jgi:hypothetical protein
MATEIEDGLHRSYNMESFRFDIFVLIFKKIHCKKPCCGSGIDVGRLNPGPGGQKLPQK